MEKLKKEILIFYLKLKHSFQFSLFFIYLAKIMELIYFSI
jgi:hypothetical protein